MQLNTEHGLYMGWLSTDLLFEVLRDFLAILFRDALIYESELVRSNI